VDQQQTASLNIGSARLNFAVTQLQYKSKDNPLKEFGVVQMSLDNTGKVSNIKCN